MLYEHYSLVPEHLWRWDNFTPQEIACNHCGEVFIDFRAMDMVQKARVIADKPIKFNSAHRCPIHNARVGGAPLSAHKRLAFDISLVGYDRHELHAACEKAGFTTFGFYINFLHTDPRPGRRWYSSQQARRIWTG